MVFNWTNKLDADRVRSLCEDREGTLWAGVGNSGLAMLRPALAVMQNNAAKLATLPA